MAVFAQTYRTAEIFFGNAAGAIIHDTEKIIDSIGAENARHYFYLQMLVACDNLSMNHCAACEQNSVAIKAPAHEGRGEKYRVRQMSHSRRHPTGNERKEQS